MAKPRILKLPEVLERTSLSKSAIYDMAQRGEFPRVIKLTERASGWLEHEVDAWLRKRIAARDAPKGKRSAARSAA